MSFLNGLRGQPGDLRLLAACIGTIWLADLAIWLRPAVTFNLGGAKGRSDSAAGASTTGAILAFSLTMLACARFARGIPFRRLALIGFALSVAMTVLTIMAQGLPAILAARAAAAIGFGILAVVPNSAISRLSNAQQGFAGMFSGGTSLAVMASVPLIQPVSPDAFPYIAYLGFAACILPLVLMLPANDGFVEQARQSATDIAEHHARWRGILRLALAFSILAIASHGIWAFFYRLAPDIGLATQEIGVLVSVATFCSILGSFASWALTRIIGRGRFICAALMVIATSLIAMVLAPTQVSFAVASSMGMCLLLSFDPAVFSLAADLDPSGRGAGFLQGAGMLVGASAQ